MSLTITPYRQKIEQALRSHRVVILVGPTGSGKTTQLGQYLLDMGESAVVTQPRRLATASLAQRVADEVGCTLGTTVGYRMMGVKVDSEETDLLFATDGLTLIRELMMQNTFSYLHLDEVHEWGVNIETLLAWAKRELENDADFNLAITSATLDTQPLVEFFGEDNTVVIEIPGRSYPIAWRHSYETGVHEAAAFLRQGKDVLVFEPGKAEIAATIKELEALGVDAVILPLHAELTGEEQARCTQNFGTPKCIVSTDAGQTSLTFPGIVVVDSGLQRRIEIDTSAGSEGFGVEVLKLCHTAQDVCRQRAGRSGRTEDGEYVLCSQVTFEERPEYSTPEIQRCLLESIMLKLALAGLDMEELEFLHAPGIMAVRQAKHLLRVLGVFDDRDHLTRLGRMMAMIPASVRTARMLVEAHRRGVLDDMVTLAAIIDQDGIVDRHSSAWRNLCQDERESDVLAHLAVWRAVRHMEADEMRAHGVHVKAYFDAVARRRRIADSVADMKGGHKKLTPAERREALLKSIAAGMVDQLYKYTGGYHTHGNDVRKLSWTTVVPGNAPWIIGKPRNLPGRKGTARILTLLTVVNPAWFAELAPQLAEVKTGFSPKYDPDLDEVVSVTEIWFNGQLVESGTVLDPDHVFASQLRRNGRNNRQWQAWTARPAIPLPDPADEDAAMPEVIRCMYGKDVVDDTPLWGYSTLVALGYRYGSSDPWFKATWTRDETEANGLRSIAAQRLESFRRNVRVAAERQRQEAEVMRLQHAAEPLRQRVRDVYRESSGLPHALRGRLVSASYFPRVVTASTMQSWTAVAEAVIAEAEPFLAELRHQQAEAERQMIAATERARALRDQANGLLADHVHRFNDAQYADLNRLDVDDDVLPGELAELHSWIEWAEVVITDAQESLARATSQSIDPAMLAKLAGKFNSNE